MSYTWEEIIAEESKKPYFVELERFLAKERKSHDVFPAEEDVFNAFKLTPFHNVKVVILGQDPYHGEGQAHGLAFSVKRGVKVPPSLVNICKELQSDLGVTPPAHGNLEHWAREGVLLMNAVLTVRKDEAHSHQGKGWEIFTDRVIEVLSEKKEHLVFVLWGAPAQKKGAKIDRNKHLVFESPHPSPLSSYRGFFGSKPFSKTNAYLEKMGMEKVKWWDQQGSTA